ncbi:hypothetical protein BDZ94DRAFT_1313891 [Collybia nuda]|uniref:Uncharacterized protein n=1 Tax=Collybia nuda TaxID=64659 RepID=A0A9P5XVG5_9AGAR|nr:hypothetical protein BDZ94DRAFT_1313891 [Collybia nuda]
MPTHTTTSQPSVPSFITLLFAIYFISTLWILIRSLEDIEDIRRLSAIILQESENSKWFKIRSVFPSQSPEADYGTVLDPQRFVAANNACHFNTWYRFRCENPDEEAARVKHLRLLNDRLRLSIPPVDWSNEPYSYDRNWCEDPLDERERIERVRRKVQLELQRERTWGAKLHRAL